MNMSKMKVKLQEAEEADLVRDELDDVCKLTLVGESGKEFVIQGSLLDECREAINQAMLHLKEKKIEEVKELLD